MSVISFELMDEIMTDDDKQYYQKLGERLATMRREQHITQVQMAQMLGISQQQVASFECGRRKVPVSMLPRLSQILQVSVEEILGMKQVVKRGPASVLNRQVEQIRLLPRTKQKFVVEMLDTVIKQQGV